MIPGLYNPKLLPDELNLADSISVEEIESSSFIASDIVTTEEKIQAARASLDRKINHIYESFGPLEPLTELEATVFEERWKLARDNLNSMLSRITATKDRISQQIEASQKARGGGDYVFTLDIEKKNRVKRALRKLLGSDSNQITYSTFLELQAAKQQMELQAIDDYATGFQEEGEDE